MFVKDWDYLCLKGWLEGGGRTCLADWLEGEDLRRAVGLNGPG